MLVNIIDASNKVIALSYNSQYGNKSLLYLDFKASNCFCMSAGSPFFHVYYDYSDCEIQSTAVMQTLFFWQEVAVDVGFQFCLLLLKQRQHRNTQQWRKEVMFCRGMLTEAQKCKWVSQRFVKNQERLGNSGGCRKCHLVWSCMRNGRLEEEGQGKVVPCLHL